MKKLLILVMVLLLAVNVCAAGGAMLKASVLRYEPAPAEQGNPVDVWIELSNEGTKADRVAVKFVPEYPFSLPAGSQGYFDVGILKFEVYHFIFIVCSRWEPTDTMPILAPISSEILSR